jgi:signal transduction histidine kinase
MLLARKPVCISYRKERRMSTTLASLAPLANWHEHGDHGHVVQLYTDDAFLLDGLNKFVGTALESGDAAVIIATQEHVRGLEDRLRSRGLDISRAARDGRYVPLDAAETLSKFMVNGSPDSVRFTEMMADVIIRATVACKSDRPRVTAFGEMVTLLWAQGQADAAERLEDLWNDLARTHRFSLHCAYPIRSFSQEGHAERFQRICAAHTRVIPNESYAALVTEEDRLRNIAHLQQKEQAHDTLQRMQEALRQEVAERADAERKLHESQQSLRDLSGRLLRLQDEERRRLGRELHDSLGQYLAVLKMGLSSLKTARGIKDEGAGEQLDECLHLAEQSLKEVRTISYLLYPPMLEEMGLQLAIPWYLDGFGKRSGIQTRLELATNIGRLPRDIELAIFRVIQESLTNVHRHSGSAVARIRLEFNAAATLEVEDEGKGIPSGALESADNATGTLGVGLRGMHERVRQLGGKLELLSSEKGTTVRATIPCQQSPV